MSKSYGRSTTWPALPLMAAAGFALGAYAGRRREDLSGKIAWVNGGSRGLGFLVAQELARRSSKVAITARDDTELEQARRKLMEISPEVLAHRCDAARREEVEAAARAISSHFGPIDILVNCASIIQVGPLESMSHQDFEEIIGINFFGYLYTVLAVMERMRRRGGTIVNVTSIGGLVAMPHLLPYTCAKFAAVGLTEGLQAELRKDGVRVINVIPGLMRTGSPVNAWFKGNAQQEWNWFSVGDSMPMLSMSACRAARRLVGAIERGDSRVVLGLPAKAMDKLHGVAPGVAAAMMAAANLMLPEGGDGAPRSTRGMHLAGAASPSLLTSLMNRAARMYNQYAGHARPDPNHARQAGVDPHGAS